MYKVSKREKSCSGLVIIVVMNWDIGKKKRGN